MDKKDFENLSERELRELKESIEDLLEEKKFKGRYLKTNQKAIRYSIRLLDIYTQILLLQQQPRQLPHLWG